MAWNVNSLRNADLRMSEEERDLLMGMDVVMLTETRLGDSQLSDIKRMKIGEKFDAYKSEYRYARLGRGKGSNGVAILLAKGLMPSPPVSVEVTFPGWSVEDMEGRYIEVGFGSLSFIAIYCPNASRGKDMRIPCKRRFEEADYGRFRELANAGQVVVM